MTSVITSLQKRLPGSEGENFSLLIIPSEDMMTASVETVKILEKLGYVGVYVALSKDYLSVSASLEEAGIDLERIRFVDAISRMYGIAPVESKEVTYVDGPLSGKALIEGITSSVREMKNDKRFVLLDSLTTILMYNSVDATVDFGKTLRDLLEKEHVAVIVAFSSKNPLNKEVISKLTKNASEVIEIEE